MDRTKGGSGQVAKLTIASINGVEGWQHVPGSIVAGHPDAFGGSVLPIPRPSLETEVELRIIAVAVLTLLLAGCVTVSNTLTPDQVASFKLVKVDVVTPPDARISWGDGEVAYAATKGIAMQDSAGVANTPEGQAYIRQTVSAKLRSTFERELAGSLRGTRPVRVQVNVREVEIASVLQRILIGGSHRLVADVAIVDAKTGAMLSQFPAQTAVAAAGQGMLGTLVDAAVLDAPIDRVVARYASQYRGWLVAS